MRGRDRNDRIDRWEFRLKIQGTTTIGACSRVYNLWKRDRGKERWIERERGGKVSRGRVRLSALKKNSFDVQTRTILERQI